MSKAVILSMINYKGGVGKTTSVFNLATGLNFLSNKKVLMIDLDPQCSLTTLCLRALSRINSKVMEINELDVNATINSVFKKYLLETRLRIPAKIDLTELILKEFYSGEVVKGLDGLDLIPATMFDDENSSYAKGLDDLEIEIAMQQVGADTLLNHITILAKFFSDTSLDEEYDFIIFDCPPSNNIITQNALLVSDYYLIPTIMDDMSSNGIAHLHSLIQNTIFGHIYLQYSKLFATQQEGSYLDYIKKGAPELLGIFETLRKSGVNTTKARNLIKSKDEFKGKLFKSIIYNHVDTARTTGDGLSCFSVNINKNSYSPHVCYSQLVEEVLQKTNSDYDPEYLKKQTSAWL
jgi:cellulose biosynthesis protein BcsQ